jgi:hypothetical protein
MVYRILPLLVIALAVALLVGMPVLAEEKANTHEGTVVSASAKELIMKDKSGDRHTHTLAAGATVTCDGKECKLDDLKPGQRIRVTTKAGDKAVATKIEALDKNKEFKEGR